MSLLSSLGSSVKAVASLVPDRATPFPQYGGIGGAYGGMAAFDSHFNTLGSNTVNGRPMHLVSGDNGVVAACSATIAQAFISAPPILEEKSVDDKGNAVWNRIDHPLIDLLNRANDFYGADQLWTRTLAGEIETGEGYFRVVMNRARTQPVELWFEKDVWPEWDADNFISIYRHRVDGRLYPLAVPANGKVNYRSDYAIQFRYQLDRNNPRRGWTPLSTVWRQVAADEATAVWQKALLDNGAGMALMISLKEGLTNGDQSAVDRLEAFVLGLKRKLRGEGAGGIGASSLPIDVKTVSWSPEQMALSSLISYNETRVCSACNVPLMLVGLPDVGKTYANLAEADRQFWANNIAPLQERHGSQIEAQLFPLYDDLNRSTHRISWDRSQVEAMQENVNEKHARVREDYKAGIPDLLTASSALGYPTEDAYKDVRFAAPKSDDAPQDDEPPPAFKAFVDALKRFDPSQPRDQDGKWTEGGSGASSSRASTSKMVSGTIEDAAKLGIKLNANHSDIHVSTDPNADVLAKAKLNIKGKAPQPKTFYHPDYEAKQREAKFDRIASLHKDLPELRKKMDAEIASNGPNAHQALALRLILKTGLRNGGDGGGGAVEAFGASSLKTSDAKVQGDTIHLDFIGKEGVRQRHTLVDSTLARHIEARQKEGQETIFDGNSAKTLGYLKKISGDKYKVHDLRTYYGTVLGAAVLNHIQSQPGFQKPKTAAESQALKMRVARVVSRDLGHGPKAFDAKGSPIAHPKIPKNRGTMALANYIHPAIFKGVEAP